MKRLIVLAALTFCFALPSTVMAQGEFRNNHFEAGVFADYFKLSQTSPDINFLGLGGRVGVNVHPNIMLEAEMNYDFKRNTTDIFSSGGSTNFVTTRIRPLTALFGPKFQVGTHGPVRAFVTGKLGFVNFSTSTADGSTGFTNAFGGITDGNTKVAFYPGAGIEGFIGPIGLRLDVGDEIYLNNGAQNNLRVSFGPHIRF